MSLVFYYAPMSSATRVHWALEELEIPYEKIKLDLNAGDQKKPEYLSLNPNGKVPLIVDEGVPIFEGLAILIYLGERYGVSKGLFPDANMERAEALKWMAWGSVSLGEAVTRLLRNTSERFPEEERHSKAAEGAKRDILAHLEILDKALEGKEYLVGGKFSLVETSLVSFLPFLARFGVDTSPYKNVSAWVGRCMSRAALARAMQG